MDHAPIMVGIDDTTRAADAMRWAAWESQRTEAPLVVVHCYRPEPEDAASTELQTTRESVARTWATHWVRDALSECAAVPWRTHLVVTPEPPTEALVRMSTDAGLLVLGRHAVGGDGSEEESSVPTQCERWARCPVVLVPPADRAAPRPVPA